MNIQSIHQKMEQYNLHIREEQKKLEKLKNEIEWLNLSDKLSPKLKPLLIEFYKLRISMKECSINRMKELRLLIPHNPDVIAAIGLQEAELELDRQDLANIS